MKIAMIGQKGYPARFGGVERHVQELAQRLVHEGHEVTVFSRSWYSDATSGLQEDGVHIRHTPYIKTKHFDALSHTFFSLIVAIRMHADIFHIHGVGPSLLAWIPRLLRPSAKVIVTFHCIDQRHEKWGRFAKFMLRLGEWTACHFPHVTITVSKSLQTYCRETYKKETVCIPNGTIVTRGAASTNPLSAFGLEAGQYLMMCSRLVRHKEAHTLIEAWKDLEKIRSDLTTGKKLAIVGGSAFTDNYVKELNILAKNTPSIVFAGMQSDEALHSLFAHAYAIVHPSSSEGMPISVLEAMSYGKCVLVSDIPEHREVVAETGLFFRTYDKRDLIEKMIILLEDADIVRTVGQAGRTRVAQHYDWDDITQTTHHLYEWLCLKPAVTAGEQISEIG